MDDITSFVEGQFKNFKLFDIGLLVKADWNYKEEDTEEALAHLESLKNNMKKNGQIENIHVRRLETGFYEVINGNHRLMAATMLGLRKLIAYDHGSISLQHAKLIAIETNETRFKSDALKLSQTMVELMDMYSIDTLLETVPFTEDDMLAMKKMLDFDLNSISNEPLDVDARDTKTFSIELEPDEYEQLMGQFSRVKKLMYPNQKPKEVSNNLPFKAMIQCIMQTNDSLFINK